MANLIDMACRRFRHAAGSTGGGALLTALLLFLPATAHAYIGPGAGISAIGTVVAVIGAVLLAIVGFVWYPIKRLRRRRKERRAEQAQKS